MKSLFAVACALSLAQGVEVSDAQKAPEIIDVSFKKSNCVCVGFLQDPKQVWLHVA